METETAGKLFSDEAETCVECLNQAFILRTYRDGIPTDRDATTEDVQEGGVIQNPGKFEGEVLATYHAYHVMLDGGADDEGGPIWRVGNVVCEDSEQGFVYGEVFGSDAEAQQAFDDAEDELPGDEEGY